MTITVEMRTQGHHKMLQSEMTDADNGLKVKSIKINQNAKKIKCRFIEGTRENIFLSDCGMGSAEIGLNQGTLITDIRLRTFEAVSKRFPRRAASFVALEADQKSAFIFSPWRSRFAVQWW